MRFGLLFFLATVLTSTAPAADHAPAPEAALFPRPASLEPQIRFWRAIFSEYSTHQVVLHDAVHLDKVYKVLDFRSQRDEGMSPAQLERLSRIETDLEMARLRATLEDGVLLEWPAHLFSGEAGSIRQRHILTGVLPESASRLELALDGVDSPGTFQPLPLEEARMRP